MLVGLLTCCFSAPRILNTYLQCLQYFTEKCEHINTILSISLIIHLGIYILMHLHSLFQCLIVMVSLCFTSWKKITQLQYVKKCHSIFYWWKKQTNILVVFLNYLCLSTTVINFLKPSHLQLELCLQCYSLGPLQNNFFLEKTPDKYISYHISLGLISTILPQFVNDRM